MKLSELIDFLNKGLINHGDVECYITDEANPHILEPQMLVFTDRVFNYRVEDNKVLSIDILNLGE